MRAVSQTFKDKIKEYGRELDSKITYTINGTTTILGMEDLNSITPHYNGDILKSVMKQLDIDSNVNIPLGTELNYQFGVKVADNDVLDYRDNFEYIDYGNYVVYSSEKKEDTNSYQIVCYDKMLYSMKDYETPMNNLLDISTFTNGYIDGSGNIVSNNANALFGYMDVEGGKTYSASLNKSVRYLAVHEFDSSKNYLQMTQVENASINTITTLDNTRYIRVHYALDNVNPMTQETIENDEPQFEKSNFRFQYPITIRNYLTSLCSYLGLTFAYSSNSFTNYDKTIPNELFLDEDGNSLSYTFRDVLDYLAQATGYTISVENDTLYLKWIDDPRYIQKEYIEGSSEINFGSFSTSGNVDIEFELLSVPSSFTIINNKLSSTIRAKITYENNKIVVYGRSTTYQSNAITLQPNVKYSLRLYAASSGWALYLYSGDTSLVSISRMNVSGFTQTCYLFGNVNVKIYKVQYNQTSNAYYPYYDNVSQKSGLYNNYGFKQTNYTSKAYNPITADYLKDANVNFGEVFGPINTITFKRTEDLDVYSLSIPSDLSDELKNEIVISGNPILEGSNRSEYASGILNQLYGLTYCINDIKTSGIGWLELYDKYEVEINIPNEEGGDRTATYPCLMLNDEVLITQGLEENIFTERPQASETDYNTASQNEREDNRASIIIDKKIGEVDIKGKTINMTADNIAITSTNFSVDTNGNLSCSNANVSGEITSSSGTIGGWYITQNTLWHDITPPYDYTSSDVQRCADIWNGTITPTQEDYNKYDFNGDGVINSKDVLVCQKLVDYNLMHSTPGKVLFDVNDWFRPIKIINSNNEILASFGVSGVITSDQ